MPDTIEYYHAPLYLDNRFLHQKYLVEGLFIAQISALIFSSKEAVRRGLERASIPIREPHLPHHGRQSQPRYGQKRSSGQLAEHKTEQRVVNAIREMRANGLGLRAIARCLDEMKVPTKARGRKWHPTMVQRIIQAATGTATADAARG